MIYVNPLLKGRKSAEFSKKDFPHLFSEDGQQTRETFIYMLFNDVIIESIESAETIKRKADEYIKHKILTITDEINTKTQTLNELKAMI